MVLQKQHFYIFVVFFPFYFSVGLLVYFLGYLLLSSLYMHIFYNLFLVPAAQILMLILEEGEHLIYYALRVTKNALFTYSQLV